jgi:hypothetical protein
VFYSKMKSWGGVDDDGRVGLSTEAPVTGRPPRESEGARGSERETEVRDDSWGRAVSEREGEAAAGAERAACWAALLGQREHGRARERMGRSVGRTGGRERIGPVRFCFSFSFSNK